ncbi:hypothetical protein [Jannaschia sp. W003]|uniref:hypothetical protein n=1 Tax=Jannaschia sp. W003 TaxID=2867012 RepID=UPI0021A2A187|nr:hypothetical protein [Jannaschia sp. W003]UWQ20134.1 hypothetical protein K3554_08955 [Jannaschia sp. W003]
MSEAVRIAVCLGLCTGAVQAQEPSITVGSAETVVQDLYTCDGGRPTDVGRITARDGTEWTVPAETAFGSAPAAPDLYNECAGVTPADARAVDLAAIPVIDAGGDEAFVAYLFGDDDFELHANGTLLGVDAVPFTPFNASVVRFTARRPVTFAFMMVDWEENLGLGSEAGRGAAYSPGDGGLAMMVTNADGAPVLLTNGDWRAQTYYVAPLTDPACLNLSGPVRDSAACEIPRSDDGTGLMAAHWPLPEGWTEPGFDDGDWPRASVYSDDTVGVDGKPAFTDFPDLFDRDGADARFIWSSNLVLDNLVLLRRTLD